MKRNEDDITNIAIVGLCPEYNNQVARLLAEQLEMYFLDSAAFFEYDLTPYTVGEIIRMNGRDWMRKKENSFTRYVGSFKNTVATYSSRVLLSKMRINNVLRHSIVIYLQHDRERIEKYTKSKIYKTPEDKSFFHLRKADIDRRMALAKQYADITINVSRFSVFKAMSVVIREIKKIYNI